MKKTLFLLSLLALLTACGAPAANTAAPLKGDVLTIAATTYPVYLFATAVADGVEGVDVVSVVNQPMSCLHDYTLTVNDMKVLEGAGIIAVNGVGLEDFMDDALKTSAAAVIDCSQGVALLPYEGHDGHDHREDESETEHYDPHIWMSPANAEVMLQNLADGLAAADPGHAEQYRDNCTKAVAQLRDGLVPEGDRLSDPQSCRLITFHDGFQYFADYFGLRLEKAIEEEEGSEASAAEIKEIVDLIRAHGIPVIFTEVNGSDATARAIARETGVEVLQLSMIMSGDGRGIGPYLDAINGNYTVLQGAFAPEDGR